MYRAAPQSFTAEFDENLTIQVGADADDGRAFDAHVSADPAAMLLLMLHRVKPAPLALRGKWSCGDGGRGGCPAWSPP